MKDELGLNRMVQLTVPGEQKAQPRARATGFKRNGKWVTHVYDPKGPCKDYRARIAHEGFLAMNGEELFEGPLFLEVIFSVIKPKSKPKYKEFPDVTPDLDNYVKAVKDALRKVVYRDDAQVCRLYAMKVYGTVPVTKIRITELRENNPGRWGVVRGGSIGFFPRRGAYMDWS